MPEVEPVTSATGRVAFMVCGRKNGVFSDSQSILSAFERTTGTTELGLSAIRAFLSNATTRPFRSILSAAAFKNTSTEHQSDTNPSKIKKIVDARETEIFPRSHARVCCVSAEKRTTRNQIARFVKVCPQIEFDHNRREIDIPGRERGSSDNDSEIARYLHL